MSFWGFGLMGIGVVLIILAFFSLLTPILSFLIQMIARLFCMLFGEAYNFIRMQSPGVRALKDEKRRQEALAEAKKEEEKRAREIEEINKAEYARIKKCENLRKKYPLADEALFQEYLDAYNTRPLIVSRGIAEKIARQHEERS